MSSAIRLLIIMLAPLLATGCSIMAPQYSPSMDNVQKLRDAGNYGMRVGQFTAQPEPGNENPISLRGSSLQSPYEKSYASYLGEAIKQELMLAGRLSPGADLEISGVLLKNDLDASGINIGTGDIEARFVLKKAGGVRYDRVVSVKHQWESSFIGAVAIPRAQQEYANLVHKLLAALYADADFLKGLQ